MEPTGTLERNGTYRRKVSEREDAQKTRLAASSVANDDQFPVAVGSAKCTHTDAGVTADESR